MCFFDKLLECVEQADYWMRKPEIATISASVKSKTPQPAAPKTKVKKKSEPKATKAKAKAKAKCKQTNSAVDKIKAQLAKLCGGAPQPEE